MEIFGRNCSSLGKVMRAAHFPSPISMLLSLHLQDGCGKEPLIRILIFFSCFLLNLKFQWKPRSISCSSKTVSKTIQNLDFRTDPEKQKLSRKKPLKLSVLLHNNLSNSSKISQSLTNLKNKLRLFGKKLTVHAKSVVDRK